MKNLLLRFKFAWRAFNLECIFYGIRLTPSEDGRINLIFTRKVTIEYCEIRDTDFTYECTQKIFEKLIKEIEDANNKV